MSDDALVQLFFHAQQLRGFLFGDAIDRNAGPVGEYFGDGLFVHEVEALATTGLSLGVELFGLEFDFALTLFENLRLLEVAALHGRFLIGADALQLFFELFAGGWNFEAANTQSRTRFVQEVNGLIGQEAVSDVAVGQVGGRD